MSSRWSKHSRCTTRSIFEYSQYRPQRTHKWTSGKWVSFAHLLTCYSWKFSTLDSMNTSHVRPFWPPSFLHPQFRPGGSSGNFSQDGRAGGRETFPTHSLPNVDTHTHTHTHTHTPFITGMAGLGERMESLTLNIFGGLLFFFSNTALV